MAKTKAQTSTPAPQTTVQTETGFTVFEILSGITVCPYMSLGSVTAVCGPFTEFTTGAGLPISEYTLNAEGMENGSKSRITAIPQSTKKVFLGNRLIAKARITMIAKIITAPAKLICNRLIYTTSLQVTDNLL